MTSQALHLLIGGWGLVAFAYIVYGPLQRQRVDCSRQRLFEIRDELFDAAYDGEISFDSPAYRRMREQINSVIRYAHRATFWRFALAWLALKTAGDDSPPDPLTAAIARADGATRKVIERARTQMAREILWLLFGRSPILMCLSFCAYLMVRFSRPGAGMRKSAAKVEDAIYKEVTREATSCEENALAPA